MRSGLGVLLVARVPPRTGVLSACDRPGLRNPNGIVVARLFHGAIRADDRAYAAVEILDVVSRRPETSEGPAGTRQQLQRVEFPFSSESEVPCGQSR